MATPFETFFEEWARRFEELGGTYILFSLKHMEKMGRRYFVVTGRGGGYIGTELAYSASQLREYRTLYDDVTWSFCTPLRDTDVNWCTDITEETRTEQECDDDSYSDENDSTAKCLPPAYREEELIYLLKSASFIPNDIQLCIQILGILRELLHI